VFKSEIPFRDFLGLSDGASTDDAIVAEVNRICETISTHSTRSCTEPNRFPRPVVPGATAFEYYRHGTLSLYAALETGSGQVIGQTASRHTSAEHLEAALLARETSRIGLALSRT
jgi:hypothetical protein